MVARVPQVFLEPYQVNAEVIGLLLVGSSSRPYQDALSDIDVEVIVSDAYYQRLSLSQRLLQQSSRVEFLFLSRSDFAAKKYSPADIDHWPYESCRILHDPTGFLTDEVLLIAALSPAVREVRLRLHYFEFLFAAKRIAHLIQRGDELNARLVAAQTVNLIVTLVFILNHRWPPLAHWTSHNLLKIETVPPDLRDHLVDLLRYPAVAVSQLLISTVDALLQAAGLSFHFDKSTLVAEVSGAEFRPVREKYGIM